VVGGSWRDSGTVRGMMIWSQNPKMIWLTNSGRPVYISEETIQEMDDLWYEPLPYNTKKLAIEIFSDLVNILDERMYYTGESFRV
jgi:hypothetical protein